MCDRCVRGGNEIGAGTRAIKILGESGKCRGANVRPAHLKRLGIPRYDLRHGRLGDGRVLVQRLRPRDRDLELDEAHVRLCRLIRVRPGDADAVALRARARRGGGGGGATHTWRPLRQAGRPESTQKNGGSRKSVCRGSDGKC